MLQHNSFPRYAEAHPAYGNHGTYGTNGTYEPHRSYRSHQSHIRPSGSMSEDFSHGRQENTRAFPHRNRHRRGQDVRRRPDRPPHARSGTSRGRLQAGRQRLQSPAGTGWSRTTPSASGKRRAAPARWTRSARNASPPPWRRTWRPGRKAVSSIPNSFAAAWTPGSSGATWCWWKGPADCSRRWAKTEYVADLAFDLGYPLVVVARNVLGTINHTLQTLWVASRYRGGLAVAGVVLNHPVPPSAKDPSVSTNRQELSARAGCPILDEVAWQSAALSPAVDWFALAR